MLKQGIFIALVGLHALGALGLTPVVHASGELREALRQRLELLPSMTVESPAAPPSTSLFAKGPLQVLYEARGWEPIWFDPEGRPKDNQSRLLEAIDIAFEHGLTPEHYHRSELERLLSASRDSQDDLASQVRLELLASDAVLTLGNHLAYGRVEPETIDSDWLIEREPPQLMAVLESANSGHRMGLQAALRAQVPRYPAYGDLVRRLSLQRQWASNEAWEPIPDGPILREGDDDPRVPAIRRRLELLGDLEEAPRPDAGATVVDASFLTGVARFQARHGLKPDGLVGRRTLAELNVSPDQRVEQLRANLERWRWLPESLGEEYILVNIAGFDMQVVQRGDVVMRQRVVVGRPYRRTPVFTGQMTYLVIHPSWEVPHSLAVKDQLPLVKENPGYLEEMGFSVLHGWGTEEVRVDPKDVDWQTLTARQFTYRLRQAPGPRNALGRVKFMFPNRHNVYLHDTPARGLFAEDDRAKSSGCIRLEEPDRLTRWLLIDRGQQMTGGALQAIYDRAEETTVRLRQPIPVHLLYWTAWADEQGRVQYRRDVYERDLPLINALNTPPAERGF
ncbi:L,D-transpeptidase family protein [Marinimicrobium sp. C6131]|uniref:L,D-transpeptidase family protein n=1 Tax=Marinimicrobium sp. C6131 TaxID=3022676 RepID=UPI00223D265F|nr:L,D-transpeptidase family protein [Marinimicrobium sp. C6131]UZJ45805.1 L,D-transpeptidase family protein [Marinimicrobium sp. C6131]